MLAFVVFDLVFQY